MTKNQSRYITNTARRLPIVFCLDVSPSMNRRQGSNSSSIELLNEVIRVFVDDLKNDPKTSTCAEVAFVTFSSGIVKESEEFERICNMETPRFETVKYGGAQMASAVLRSIEKLEDRRQQLKNSDLSCYSPFLVLVTDGNSDRNDDEDSQEKTLAALEGHCDFNVKSEMIIPLVIGVGDDINAETLNRYARCFADGYISINGTTDIAGIQFKEGFQLISNSIKISTYSAGNDESNYRAIQDELNELRRRLAGE